MNCLDNSHDHRGHGPYRVTTQGTRARSSSKSPEVTGQEVVITEPSGKHSLRTGEPVELGGVLSDSLDDDRSGILRHGR
jgi:hypothetical protein